MNENAPLLSEIKLLRAAIESIAADLRQTVIAKQPPARRNCYTVDQFAAELLDGNLSAEWVRDQIAAKKIKSISTKPALISHAEAMRYLSAGK